MYVIITLYQAVIQPVVSMVLYWAEKPKPLLGFMIEFHYNFPLPEIKRNWTKKEFHRYLDFHIYTVPGFHCREVV